MEERSSVNLANGVLTMRNVPLRVLLAEIYLMTPDDIVGPSWLSDVRVDIIAKAASHDASDADLREMTKALLRDRMKMVARIEPRPRSVWALDIWKGRHKLKPSTSPARPEDAACRRRSAETGVSFFCQHMSMAEFAHEIPQIAGRYTDQRVVDQTAAKRAHGSSNDRTRRAEQRAAGARAGEGEEECGHEVRPCFFSLSVAARSLLVMRGLVPRIHAFVSMRGRKTWMPGIKPGMTGQRSPAMTLRFLGRQARHEAGHDEEGKQKPRREAGVFGFFIRARDQYFATTGALPHGSPPKR